MVVSNVTTTIIIAISSIMVAMTVEFITSLFVFVAATTMRITSLFFY
jgi:hypothetical protein